MNFIKIEGWSAPRAMGMSEGGKSLDIQVKAICRDCSACKGRVAWMKQRLAALGLEGRWREDESVVTVPEPGLTDEESGAKERWLSHLFQAPVVFVTWLPA